MAEETNIASSSVPPTSIGPAEDPTDEGDVVRATDVSMTDVTSETTKEGANQAASPEAPKTNGDTEHAMHPPTDEQIVPPFATVDTETVDTEMKDVADAGEEPQSSAPPTNGTPQTSKRASVGGSSKKKSSAIPEHKSKKLNKKKSRPLTHLDAQPGQYYIARMKGHPPWPSIVCDEEMLPESLLKSRPVTAKLPDGSYKKPEYADGGKRVYERTFPIMFLYTNEFAWVPNTELNELDVLSEAVQEPVEKGKSKTLLSAYAIAAENNELDYYKTMLNNHNAAVEEDKHAQEEAEAERAAKKVKKAERAARKSETLAADEDESTSAEKPKSKKRKKAEDEDDAEEKPKTTKLKLSTPKTPAAESSAKKKVSKTKAKPQEASEEENATPKFEEKPLTPQQAKEIKEKRVLYFRHKLQRGFLSRDTPPKEEEMTSMSEFLRELEGFPDLESSIIRATKIHKVLKAMIKLPSIPSEEEFKFKDRSHSLLDKWNEILSADTSVGPSGDKDDEKPEAAAPTTNGDAKSTGEQVEKAEAGEAAAPEEENLEELEKKVGTTVEGAKEAEKSEEKATEPKKTADEQKTDAPAIDSAPAEAYKPEESVEATA